MDVLTNVRSLFSQRIQKKHLQFEWDIDPSIPEWLQGDPHRLNQVLINLVGNAIKFTEKGSIHLGVNIVDRGTPGQLTLSFSVADTGIGIPAASLPHIFESFSQAGMDVSRRYGGTGLGLAICHQLLQMQGGSITVSSVEGKGSTFTCTLPFGSEPVVNTTRQVAHSLKDFDGCFKDRRFLVVEDNPVNQKLMEYVLRKTGAAISVADNGEEALALLKTEEFDLIVMDLQMPGIDGYEATRRLRNDLRLKTPVMAMTANAITGERIRCLEAGMNDYMSKPFDFREFYTRVAGLLQTSQALPATQSTAVSGDKSYSLSLLEEIGDEEYLQDILQTFLTNLPQQVAELQTACDATDHDKVFFIAHKLKGTCGMLQAAALVEKLALVQQLAKGRSDASVAVAEIATLVEILLPLLEQEKHRHTLTTSSSNSL
jgi:CheY-like chemotaxis protein